MDIIITGRSARRVISKRAKAPTMAEAMRTGGYLAAAVRERNDIVVLLDLRAGTYP
jgi:hypothetical protein